jgi:hypothetical protein
MPRLGDETATAPSAGAAASGGEITREATSHQNNVRMAAGEAKGRNRKSRIQ